MSGPPVDNQAQAEWSIVQGVPKEYFNHSTKIFSIYHTVKKVDLKVALNPADTIAVHCDDPTMQCAPAAILFRAFLRKSEIPELLLEGRMWDTVAGELRRQAVLAIAGRSQGVGLRALTDWLIPILSTPKAELDLFPFVQLVDGYTTKGQPLKPMIQPSLHISLSDAGLFDRLTFRSISGQSQIVNLGPGDAILYHPDTHQLASDPDEDSTFLRLHSDFTQLPPSLPTPTPTPPETDDEREEREARELADEIEEELDAENRVQDAEMDVNTRALAQEKEIADAELEDLLKETKRLKRVAEKRRQMEKRRGEMAVKDQALLMGQKTLDDQKKRIRAEKAKIAGALAREAEEDGADGRGNSGASTVLVTEPEPTGRPKRGATKVVSNEGRKAGSETSKFDGITDVSDSEYFNVTTIDGTTSHVPPSAQAPVVAVKRRGGGSGSGRATRVKR